MRHTKEERFQQHVLSKYQIYNSIFMTLPFDAITRTGVLLPLFQEVCEKGFANQKILLKSLLLFLSNTEIVPRWKIK